MAKENNKTNKNDGVRLTPHFTLEEMTRTNVKLESYLDRQRQQQPKEEVIENLTRVCQWLEMLRERYNSLTPNPSPQGEGNGLTPNPSPQGEGNGLTPNPSPQGEGNQEEPIIVTSGYRSPAVNKAVGGCKTSNHLTGCAADLRVLGKEQLLRYAVILLDISDEARQDFDELLLERNARGYWLHFAVRPKNNRRKIQLINVI